MAEINTPVNELLAPPSTPVDELLAQTINLFENNITTTDIKVALDNVNTWIAFLERDESSAAPEFVELLKPLRDHLKELNVPQIKQDIVNLGHPTTEAGDPMAPVGSRPRQISRLGVLVCGS